MLEQLRAGKLAGSARLTLSCGLQEFPREIFDLADTLEILDLSGNALSSLPDDLPRLRKLRILFCSNNRFTELPAVLGQCPQLGMVGFKANQIRSVPTVALPPALRWLILTDNQIAELPSELGRCTQLQKLMLAGNRLHSLPATLAACTRLELLRIAANRLTELPAWLFELPRLSWLAYAGNPFCENHETAALLHMNVAGIGWGELQLQRKLGEGASGVIHRAVWQRNASRRDVAVKLFKGAVTSDGLPHSEMAACIRAGEHPNLIAVHGRIVDHPAANDGLVMSLVTDGFGNLAGPPSLDSCTRDIYADDAAFSVNTAIRIALGIALAARHLHAQDIMHGDLYAHNILCTREGETLLGDFGAASFIAPEDRQRAEALQRIEVRAFSCLLEELLERCSAEADPHGKLPALVDLQSRCAMANSQARPLFAEIESELLGLR
ncbi:leucine-rich repeat-containing protein kinase family protein [Sideroxyarcus emersonii]|uniref:leucine-rich repeat-containing protein kinase family protein n=1 Tax=Sideroxyarcus emersonii TaxID=2764705 RepID=UPI001F1DF680|nr:leucine-rich repeat-containing protein kinase family protein [Sideroxyarcus emersonii]